MTFWDWLSDQDPMFWIFGLLMLLLPIAIIFGDCDGVEEAEQNKAEDQCLSQGGVPLYTEYGNLADCKFKP